MSVILFFYKAPNNSIDSDLKSCSEFVFYSSESIKLHENLNILNRNTSLAYFAISKHFLKRYKILLLLSGDITLNSGLCQI